MKLRRPHTLAGCLKVLEEIKYEAFGFAHVFLDYRYNDKKWSVTFRNPVNFDNPKIRETNPLDACHKMIDFLNSLIEDDAFSNLREDD